MNIKLKPKKKSEGAAFYFALLPESIQGSMGACMQSFDIISRGTVKVPKGSNVREVKWSGEFFGSSKKKEAAVKSKKWKSPKKSVNQLKKWMDKGTVLNIVVSGTWINMDVTISSLDVEEHGAYGNVRYTITLTQYRKLKIYTTKELKVAGIDKGAAKTKERDGRDDGKDGGSKGNYTVVNGDTLWGIALARCGGSSNWPKLYDANAETIEAEAKRHGRVSSDHGHWIYPGEVLILV